MVSFLMVVQALGVSGLFVARALGPLFVLALACRIALAEQYADGLLAIAAGIEPWFVSDDVIIGLGAGALLEWALHHSRAVRARLRGIEVYYKAAAAVVGFIGIGAAGDHVLRETPYGREAADALGFEPRALAVGVFFCTLIFGLVRRSALHRLSVQDRDDDLGMQRLTAWAEDLWTLSVPVLFVLYPPGVLPCVALAMLLALSLRRALRVHEESDKVICICGQLNYRPAPRCAQCGGRNQAPSSVGLFGQATADFARDVVAHAHTLFEVKRCPRCATHLSERTPTQVCRGCGQTVPSDPVFLSDYDRRIRGRAFSALFVTALLGALPVVGLIPAIFHARRALIAPYARYVSRLESLFVRAGLWLAWLVAIATQLVPGVGALGLSLAAFSSHRAYRAAFMRGALADDDDF